MSCADKLDNISVIVRDYNELGEAFWRRFNASKEKQKWYYNSLAEVYSRRLSGEKGSIMALKFKSIVNSVFIGENS